VPRRGASRLFRASGADPRSSSFAAAPALTRRSASRWPWSVRPWPGRRPTGAARSGS
jgi:hypothetical protein